MFPELEAATRRWQRVTDYLVEVARAVEPSKWDESCPYPGWSNKDLLAHLATGYPVRIAWLDSVLEAGRPVADIDVDAANAARISERRNATVEQLIEEMVATRGRLLELMGRLKEEHLAVETEVAGWPRGRGPFGEYVKEMSRHDLEHAAELQPVLARPVALPDPDS